MNAATLEALKGSIRKWEKIVAGTGMDNGAENCPLCHLFIEARCEGCPISAKIDIKGCAGTPFEKWAIVIEDPPRRADTPEQKALAQAELDFLKSLLPEDDHDN